MRLVLEGDTVKFEPDFKDFEVFMNWLITLSSLNKIYLVHVHQHKHIINESTTSG